MSCPVLPVVIKLTNPGVSVLLVPVLATLTPWAPILPLGLVVPLAPVDLVWRPGILSSLVVRRRWVVVSLVILASLRRIVLAVDHVWLVALIRTCLVR